MKLTAPVLVSRYQMQGSLVVPQDMPLVAPPENHQDLMKVAVAAVAKNVSGFEVAHYAWHFTTVPNANSPEDLIDWLVNNNVPSDKAPVWAIEIRSILSNPLVRSVLFGICGASMAYLVVEKTSWSARIKWSVILGVGIAVAAGYFLLRHYGILH